MRIEFSGTAERDLRSIRTVIEKDDERAAERVILRILQSVRHLANFPELGREWMGGATRALSIPGLPYRVHYQVSGEIVEVLTVVHTRRKHPD